MRTIDEGSNSTEYVVHLALIAAVIAASVLVFGDMLKSAFEEQCTDLAASVTSAGTPTNCSE